MPSTGLPISSSPYQGGNPCQGDFGECSLICLTHHKDGMRIHTTAATQIIVSELDVVHRNLLLLHISVSN